MERRLYLLSAFAELAVAGAFSWVDSLSRVYQFRRVDIAHVVGYPAKLLHDVWRVVGVVLDIACDGHVVAGAGDRQMAYLRVERGEDLLGRTEAVRLAAVVTDEAREARQRRVGKLLAESHAYAHLYSAVYLPIYIAYVYSLSEVVDG